MACISPPEPEDAFLLAVLDGEGESEVEQHLRLCPHCQRRVDELASLGASLTATLYRAGCPSPEELGDYHLKLLAKKRSKEIGNHLAMCPHCSTELMQLRDFLEAAEEDIVVRAGGDPRLIIATPLAQMPSFETAAVRGPESEEDVQIFEAGSLQISLLTKREGKASDVRSIAGLVVGSAEGEWGAELRTNEKTMVTTDIDQQGNFRLEQVRPGRYSLAIVGPELEVLIEQIEV